MKLTDAKFCVDCEEVFEGAECPKCGNSVSSISLNHWLRSLQCPEGMSYLAHRMEARNQQSSINNHQSEAAGS